MAFRGQEIVICATATTNLASQLSIVDAAVKAGVKRFVPSEFGFDSSTPTALEHAPCLKPKRDAVEYLRSVENTGMTWTSFITGLVLDWVCYRMPRSSVWQSRH